MRCFLLALAFGSLLFGSVSHAQKLELGFTGQSADLFKNPPGTLASDPILVDVVGATWCPMCKTLLKSFVDKGLFPASVNQKLPILPVGRTSTKIGGQTYAVEVRYLNFDMLSSQAQAAVLSQGPLVGFPTFRFSRHGKLFYQNVYGSTYEAIVENQLQAIAMIEAIDLGKIEELKAHFLDSSAISRLSEKMKGKKSIAVITSSIFGPDDNADSINRVMTATQEILGQSGRDNFVTLYGAGPTKETLARVTSKVENEIALAPRKPKSVDQIGNRKGLIETFAAARTEAVQKLLLITVGHGSPLGGFFWNELPNLGPDELSKYLAMSKTESISINGTCHSGIFRKKNSCGFYAARPELVASGCGTDDPEKNYVRRFMDAFVDTKKFDLNRDGKISFAEGHWAAFDNTVGDVPYSDVDALSDELVSSLNRGTYIARDNNLQDIVSFLSADEKYMYAQTSAAIGQVPGAVVLGPTENEKARRFRSQGVSFDLSPLSPLFGVLKGDKVEAVLTSPAMDRLTQLVRRGFLRMAIAEKMLTAKASAFYQSELNRLTSCENQSVLEFLEP